MRISVWIRTVSVASVILNLPLSGQITLGAKAPRFGEQDWTNYVRIGGYGLKADNADKIVVGAENDGVFGIEVDNDIEGRYESFLDPKAKLEAIRAVAEKAHAVGNYAYVYVAGTECITANADSTPHTLAKDHPNWLQRKITGEPAIFGGGTAFWIAKGDEDVWVTPYAPEWRKRYMERIRQIAATGIDGIYVDIPLLDDSISNVACAPDDLEVTIVSHRPRRQRQVPTYFRVQISRHEYLSSRIGVIRKRATGQLKSRWQNILGSVHGRMPRHGMQHVAPCKLFSQCFLLSSYSHGAVKFTTGPPTVRKANLKL